MNFAKILHFEGQHKLFLLLSMRGKVIGEDHKIIDIKCDGTKLAITGMSEYSMIQVQASEGEFLQLIFSFHIPCSQGLFKPIKTLS